MFCFNLREVYILLIYGWVVSEEEIQSVTEERGEGERVTESQFEMWVPRLRYNR